MPLIINNKHVNKISGPVSMYLLYPKIEYTDIAKNKYAPIFILFGDSHGGVKNYCNPDEGEDKGYYKVYDVNFLKLFSDAMEGNEEKNVKSEIIDFYVEGGDAHITKFKKRDDDYPLSKTMNLFEECYYNHRMDKPPANSEKQKQIKNIRWQSGDIRNFVKKNGRCDLYTEIEDIIQECKCNKELRINNPQNEKLFKRLLTKAIEYNYRKPIIEELTSDELYIEHVLNPNCLIAKQLNKINLGEGGENAKNKTTIIQDIQSKFKAYIDKNYIITNIINENRIAYYKQIHKNIINAFKSFIYSDQRKILTNEIYKFYQKGNLETLMTILINRDSVLPDLYILARSYKYMYTTVNPKYGLVYPMINICYFGSLHTKRMYEFLIENGYEHDINIDYDINVDVEPSRCINLTNLSNLDFLITDIKKDARK